MRKIEILILTVALVMCGCRSQKLHKQPATPTEPAWHTCLVQNADATLYMGEDAFRSTCTMQTVRDSLVVLSITPMLGLEMFRVEATAQSILVVDKMQRRYMRVGYEQINRYVTPKVRYSDLQQMASGEILPPNAAVGRVEYLVGGKKLALSINYPVRQLDVTLNLRTIDLMRYQNVDLQTWMK